MEEKKRLRTLCLVCGRPSLRPICALCAARLKREALREEIEDEKHGNVPHIWFRSEALGGRR